MCPVESDHLVNLLSVVGEVWKHNFEIFEVLMAWQDPNKAAWLVERSPEK